MKTFENFYWETAKFAFSLIGGGTAGYLLARGANAVVNKATEIAAPRVVAKYVELRHGKNEDGEAQTLTV